MITAAKPVGESTPKVIIYSFVDSVIPDSMLQTWAAAHVDRLVKQCNKESTSLRPKLNHAER